ncbi:MAG TPA: hypothetical protein VK053_20825, partial [Jiangellaceae bacterium]|nr:hypothetical protein [Jiangellaceae bacterium]
MLNWAFKKLFRTKSPFTLRGMQAMAGNPLAVAGATGAGGALVKNQLEKGRHQLTNSLINAGKTRLGQGKASADSKSAAAGEELLGDAENPVPTDKQVTSGATGALEGSAQQAVTDGTGQADGAANGAVEADAQNGPSGETTTTTVEDGENASDAPADETAADDSMVAAAIGGPAGVNYDTGAGVGAVGSRSLGQRLTDFEDSGRRDENLDRASNQIAAAATTVGAGAVRAGREGRLAVGRARAVPANLRRQIAGGAGLMKQKWNDGKATRAKLWHDPGLAAQFLATRGAGAATKVIGTTSTKLKEAAKNPATYTKAMKGAALYGGLALASGGLAVPAAVVGGRALAKHRRSIAGAASGAAKVGAGALTGVAKGAYRSGVPEMTVQDRDEAIQSMELDKRIRADQSDQTQAPITELAQGLPVVQERQLAAEMRDATASYDAFEAENGRAPEAAERTAMVEDLPFYSSMNADAELRGMFEDKVAAETEQANQLFDAYQAQHGEEMSAEQMRIETSHLPFYSQSVRGLDPRQAFLSLSGTGNDAAPQPVTVIEPRSFDPLATGPEPATVPAGQGALDLGSGEVSGAGEPGRIADTGGAPAGRANQG